MDKVFSDTAWADYIYWLQNDKSKLKRINRLLKSIDRDGNYNGIGKPEPLKYSLGGYWSRRISDEHRLIYRIKDNRIYIVSCRDHY
ncbi:MAG: Txe/YoeB family addiction module toxin [Clostridia bacterium]|nr:Txe/YoeB family addiction module toxin [Clostridia bacterium]